MIEGSKVLGIIPARGGSKGIPGKNMIEINGVPLLEFSLNAVESSEYLDEVVVSTDSKVIKDHVNSLGKKTKAPFLRPSELATDTALTIDVMRHAIEWFSEKQEKFEIYVLLQPTSPLRIARDIDICIETFVKNKCTSVVSVKNVGGEHPARMYRISDGLLDAIMGENTAMQPRQELEPLYIRSGSVYITSQATINEFDNILGNRIVPVELPLARSVNIDNYADLAVAEYYLRHEAD